MKTMTCRDLGGPCGVQLRGDTANEIIKAQDNHLKELVAGGDASHGGASNEMKNRWKHPFAGMGWYRKAKWDFAALPDD
jgi:predicted small metal-binding protein